MARASIQLERAPSIQEIGRMINLIRERLYIPKVALTTFMRVNFQRAYEMGEEFIFMLRVAATKEHIRTTYVMETARRSLGQPFMKVTLAKIRNMDKVVVR